MRVLGEATLVRGGAPCKVDMVDLCDICGKCAWREVDLPSVVRCTRAVNIESSEDLRN